MLTTQRDSETCFSLHFKNRLNLRIFPIPAKHPPARYLPELSSFSLQTQHGIFLWNLQCLYPEILGWHFTSGTFTSGRNLWARCGWLRFPNSWNKEGYLIDYPTKPPFKVTPNDVAKIFHTVRFFLLGKTGDSHKWLVAAFSFVTFTNSAMTAMATEQRQP